MQSIHNHGWQDITVHDGDPAGRLGRVIYIEQGDEQSPNIIIIDKLALPELIAVLNSHTGVAESAEDTVDECPEHDGPCSENHERAMLDKGMTNPCTHARDDDADSFDGEVPADEPDEPGEDDYYLSADERSIYYNRKRIVGPVESDAAPCTRDAVMRKLAEYVERNGYAPNVWSVSDHGNATLISVQECGCYFTEHIGAECDSVLPPCVRVMRCYCAGHARGNPANAPCDTTE